MSGGGVLGVWLVTTVSSLAWSDTGRSAGTSYSYRVRARDAAGNGGAYSSVVTAVTPSAPDNPPSAPSGLAAVASGSSEVNLSWTAATDDVGVSLYEVERCQGAGCSGFVQVATTASTSLADTGLLASTSYSYRVRARDTAGQVGAVFECRLRDDRSSPTAAVGEPRRCVRVRRGYGDVRRRSVRQRECGHAPEHVLDELGQIREGA